MLTVDQVQDYFKRFREIADKDQPSEDDRKEVAKILLLIGEEIMIDLVLLWAKLKA